MTKKAIAVGIVSLFVISGLVGMLFLFEEVQVKGSTLYVGGGGVGNYSTIQSALNNANQGDSIFVYSGTYYENIDINKTINLIGEDRNTTIINGSSLQIDTVYVSENWVNITGFTIIGSYYWEYECIKLNNVQNCEITNNNISSRPKNAISLYSSSNNTLINNNFANSWNGIHLDSSSNNTIVNNKISITENAIWLVASSNNTIINNSASDNFYGLYLHISSNNTVKNNSITSNDLGGIMIHGSSNNVITKNDVHLNDGTGVYVINGTGIFSSYLSINNEIYHNNIIENTNQAYDESTNHWDNGYPSGGNYWSDYSGVDYYSGPNQDILGSDGFGDTSYVIDSDSQDNYPITEPLPDTIPPRIKLYLPDNNSVIPQGTILDFYIFDGNLDFVNYSLNGDSTQIILPPFNISTIDWPEGTHTVQINAIDLAENSNSSTFYFTIDSTPPSIWFDPNLNHSIIPVGKMIQINVTGPDTEAVMFSLDGGGKSPLIGPYIINTSNWTHGLHTVTINAYDIAGNEASTWFDVNIDAIAPEVINVETIHYINFSADTDTTIINLTFSESMNQTNTQNYVSISIPVYYTLNWDAIGKILTMSFTTEISSEGNTYNLTIDSKITDINGTQMISDFITSLSSLPPQDTDGDGIPDSKDTDDDNDGYLDEDDAFILDPSEWLDTDLDGIGDNADLDDDNDGHIDEEDYYPKDPTRWSLQTDISVTTISVSKYGPSAGEEVTIYVEIQNAGNNDCDVIVKYYDGDPDDGGTQIGSNHEITITSGDFFSVTQSWVATAGNHTLCVIVEDLTTGEKVTAYLPITVGDNIQPVLVLTTGDINIYRFEPGQERTISVEITCYRQSVNNVRLVVLDDQNLTIDSTITPSITMTDGQTTKFYLRVKAPRLPEGVDKLEKDILIQAVGDNGIFSNAEELDIVVSESAVTFLDPIIIAGAVATGSLATLGVAAAASRRNENWKYLLLLTFAVPLYTRIHGKKTLDNFVRGQVYGHIQSKPGTHFNDIKKTLKVGNGNLAYHLRKLEKEGFIKSSRDKRYRRFYPVGVEVVEDDGIKLSKTQESILDYIEQHPKSNQKEIAKELKESQQTISYNLNVLVREGFLTEEKFKGTKRYEIIEENT